MMTHFMKGTIYLCRPREYERCSFELARLRQQVISYNLVIYYHTNFFWKAVFALEKVHKTLNCILHFRFFFS